MNITQNSIDKLNSIIKVTIGKDDYTEKVEKALKDYRKTASIKGFRKGQVPMGYLRKQFEKGLIYDEVNKMLQNGINEFIQKEDISMLGNPLPVEDESFDWDADELNFEFEIGLAPEFEVDLAKIKTDYYKVVVGEEDVQKYIDNFAQRFGELKTLDKVEEKSGVKVEILEVDKDKNPVEDGIGHENYLFVDELAKPKKLIGKKAEDVVIMKAKEISEDHEQLAQALGITPEEAKEFDGQVQVTVKEISIMEPSAIEQSLFDKVYGEGAVKSEEEFRSKIKEEAENMYVRETDQQMMNDVVHTLIKETKFDLPTEFLKKWLQFNNENIKSAEEAEEQLKKEDEGLRYQLIESKLAEKYDLNVGYEDVEAAIKANVKSLLAQYGQADMPEEDFERIVQSSMQNQDEFKRTAEQVFGEKMKNVFKENVKLKEKEVSFDEFAKIMEEKHKEHHHDHDHEH